MSSLTVDNTPRKSILKKGIGNEKKHVGNVKVLIPENEDNPEIKETRGRSRTLVIEGKEGLIIREGGSLQPISPLHSAYEDDPDVEEEEADSINTDDNNNNDNTGGNSVRNALDKASASTPNLPATQRPATSSGSQLASSQPNKERGEVHQKDRAKSETKPNTKKNSKDKNTIHLSLSKEKNELQPRGKNEKKKAQEDEKDKCLIS